MLSLRVAKIFLSPDREKYKKKFLEHLPIWECLGATLSTNTALLKAPRRKARKELPFYLERRTTLRNLRLPGQDDPTYFIRKLRDVI